MKCSYCPVIRFLLPLRYYICQLLPCALFHVVRYREIRLGSFRAGCARVESGSCYLKNENESAECAPGMSDQFVPSRRYHHNKSESFKFYNGRHYFSSHAGMKSSEDEDDLEDGFSELERTASANEIEARSDNELISESEISDGDSDDEVSGLKNELELSDTAAEVSKENVEPKRHVNRLLRAILNAPGLSIKSVLDKWVEDGNEVNKTDIMVVNSSLRRRKMFGRALQVCLHFHIFIWFVLGLLLCSIHVHIY